MLTPIPAYAKPAVDAFLATGTMPGLDQRQDFNQEDAAYMLGQIRDEFTGWAKQDETADDKLSGQKGEVYVSEPFDHYGGYTQVSFEGDEKQGLMVAVNNSPTMHFGAVYTDVIRATPDSVDRLTLGKNGDIIIGENVTHIDLKTGTGYTQFRYNHEQGR